MKHLAPAGLWLLLACADATPPDRTDTYAFAIDCGVPNFCTDSATADLRLVFRWPAAALPVRIWVEPRANLRELTRESIRTWERAALYGEFAAVLVQDSVGADVILRLDEPQIITNNEGLPPLNCRGQTDIQIGLDTALVLPLHTLLVPRRGADGPEVNACLEAVVLHELGHSLGLLLHSTGPDDVMYGRPTTALLSHRDVDTFSLLYHSTPTVYLPAGR